MTISKKQKHTGLAICNTKAGMFSKMQTNYNFCRFEILKIENNIFEIRKVNQKSPKKSYKPGNTSLTRCKLTSYAL